jgi:hypothetical protein
MGLSFHLLQSENIAYRSGHLMIEISLRNEEMNDHLSLLLQGYAAKRELAALFQSELFGQAKQPPITIAAREPIPAVQRDIKQASKLFQKTVASTDLSQIGYHLSSEQAYLTKCNET